VYEPTSLFAGADALGLTVDDQGATGLGKAQQATSSIAITVTNQAPSDIALSSASVNENQPLATTVGSFSTTDADPGDAFLYSLVAGTGATDNGSFQIIANTLQTNAVFDFEAKASFSIRAGPSDGGGLFFEQVFTITVTNLNQAPTNIRPTASSI